MIFWANMAQNGQDMGGQKVGNVHYQIWNTFRCFQRLPERVKDLNLT
mgnify:CR=1 FL=1